MELIKYSKNIVKRLNNIFTRKEKRQFLQLLVAILLIGLLEVAGVASILPFMQLMSEPDAINNNPFLNQVYTFFAFQSERNMLIASGIAVIVLITCSNLFAVFVLWLQYNYTWRTLHQISTRLLKVYVNKPYRFYLTTNTSELHTYLLSEVGIFTSGILLPIIELMSRITVSLVIFGVLVWVNPFIAFSTMFTLGGVYFIIYIFRRHYIKTLGEDRIQFNLNRFKVLSEFLTGIKTIKAYNAQAFFHQRFGSASKQFTEIMPQFQLIMNAPKYILEIFAFGGILSITLYLYISLGDIRHILPMLSLYALAGYRLLPALQRAFAAVTKLRHNLAVFDRIYDDLVLSLAYAESSPSLPQTEKLPFQKTLTLENISFCYEGNVPLFNNFNLEIKKGTSVAFIGTTGSGKTTLIDLIVGLLFPETGTIRLDETALNPDNIYTWQQQVAYVPQDVFLFDESILTNIAIGTDSNNIDSAYLKQVCQMADIYDFIVQELEDGFDTMIGENGLRLSGGQRQRLGLARALYRRPDVLILDEATSALDNITEKSVIESLDNLPDDLTLIIIAHRLSSVRYADCLYLLESGKIAAKGSYDELIHLNETFRTMVQLS